MIQSKKSLYLKFKEVYLQLLIVLEKSLDWENNNKDTTNQLKEELERTFWKVEDKFKKEGVI